MTSDPISRARELLIRASTEYNAGRHLPALLHAEESARLNIPLPGLHCLLAACYFQIGRLSDAQAAISKELALPKPHAEAAIVQQKIRESVIAREQAAHQPRTWEMDLNIDQLKSIQAASHRYHYRGVPLLKNPFDLAIYPILLWDLKPGTIFEVGSFSGGSALWLADMLDNHRAPTEAHIYSADVIPVTTVSHARISFLDASSPGGGNKNLAEVFTADLLARAPRPWLVIEDADHTYATTRAVLEYFHPYLLPGDFFAVEDSAVVLSVRQALDDFHAAHPGAYRVDAAYCDFWGRNLTWCMNGFLKRIAH